MYLRQQRHAAAATTDDGPATDDDMTSDLRHLLGVEVDDAGYEVVAHDDLTHAAPVDVTLAQQRADRLERHFDHFRWVVERAHLHQVLLLDALDSCKCTPRAGVWG